MVKRITASLLLVLVGAISILAQIDYNKQIKNLPTISQGNTNAIRVVDGTKFAQSAAGINAADADLGTATGEIWIPSNNNPVVATDAQITLSKSHTLRLLGRLQIDAVNKGPILLNSGSKIVCNESDSSQITNVGVGTVPSMIKLAVNDGSVTDGLYVEGCLISAGIQPVTNGVIDASGSVNHAHIRDNYIFGFTSGWGIFVQDIQSGALGGTDNLIIQGNNITASNPGSGGCIDITHSATNNVVLNNISIIDTTCIPGPSLAAGAAVVFQNLSPANNRLEQVNLLNVNIFSIPTSQEGVYLNGVLQATLKQIACYNGTSCVYIASNTNNLAISAENITCSQTCVNSIQDIANNYVNSSSYINHYGFTATINGLSGDSVVPGKEYVGNFNNIRIVDGVHFPKSAAGINAADADLGATNNGEIWVTNPTTATDAQISITSAHTLKIFALTVIDAVGKGPILLGTAARLQCVDPGPANNAQILQNAAGTVPSMVRLTVQDGSQDSNQVEGCFFFAGNNPVTNGVIDASGFTARSFIRDNKITGFTSGWGIFLQDIQSGALVGTFNLSIMNNTIIAGGTGGCIEGIHSSTVAEAMGPIFIQDLYCSGGGSLTTAPIVFQDLSGNALFRQVVLSNSLITGGVASQPGFTDSSIEQFTARDISCYIGVPCAKITGLNPISTTLKNIFVFTGGNTLNDSFTSTTIGGPSLLNYESQGNATGYGFYPNVSYLKVNGLAPASCTSTGTGTGPTCAFDAGSTNNTGVISITAGTTPSSSGTVTLNFNTTQTNFGAHNPACVFNLSNFGASWNARATVISNATSTTSFIVNWDNNAVNLTASSGYFLTYWCAAK